MFSSFQRSAFGEGYCGIMDFSSVATVYIVYLFRFLAYDFSIFTLKISIALCFDGGIKLFIVGGYYGPVERQLAFNAKSRSIATSAAH
jgi:hypothetical protein